MSINRTLLSLKYSQEKKSEQNQNTPVESFIFRKKLVLQKVTTMKAIANKSTD